MSNDLSSYVKSTPAARQWKSVGIRHHHGICLPLFSVRTSEGGGIGEYPDLIPLITWLKEIKFDVLQLLPLYDTHGQSSPYSPVSAYALNPIYLSLKNLPNASGTPGRRKILEELSRLNLSPRVNYSLIHHLKTGFLDDYVLSEGAMFLKEKDYQKFVLSQSWLNTYAVYKALSSLSGTTNWEMWKEEWKNPGSHMDSLAAEHRQLVEKYSLIQYFCWRQLSEVKSHADSAGVLIKGDCPILIGRESADVWADRTLFKLDYSVGAPPDYYNPEGQDWGFPLYDWNSHANEEFSWWKNRLRALEPYCHLYRLDHVVGFYRIWAHWGRNENGFIPEDPSIWISDGESRLRALLADSDLLPIGEDLGTVPREVKRSLKHLGICGTKVLRWETRQEDQSQYIPFEEYEPLSMSTLSTHDSETFASWWKTHREEARNFSRFMGWNEEAELTFDRHLQILKACHSTPSLFHINLIQEYLSLFDELSHPDPADERINTPGVNSALNWTYRLKPTIEEIRSHQELNQVMRAIKE